MDAGDKINQYILKRIGILCSKNMMALFKRIARAVHGGVDPRHDDGRIVLSTDVRASLSDHGVVFLNTRSGSVFRSNRIGAEIWKGLADGFDPVTITAQIANNYGVALELVTEDTRQFLCELEKRGFLMREVET